MSIGLSMAQSPSEIARAVQTADDLMYRDKIARRNEAHKRIADALLLNMAKKDYDSSENTHRLSALACFVGRRLGLTESQVHRLSLLAHVHDIGTISIPDHVLFKEGPLTNAERALVHTHPEKGHRIASHCTDLAEVADLILKHHERWDGTGYPLGLAGDEIPTECRVFSLVDAFCSMTGPRPFRGARTHDGALDEIERCTGTQFDPRLVPGFVSSMREYAHE